MEIIDILKELNLENGSNYKKDILNKYKNNELLFRVFQMSLDKVRFTFGITLKNIKVNSNRKVIDLSTALKELDKLCTRELTGNKAILFLEDLLSKLSTGDKTVLERVINRDLKVNIGKRLFNTVASKDYKVVRPPYMRCGIYTEKTAKKINFPAIVQIKADGQFCAITVDQGNVTFNSRSGEEREFPHLETKFNNFKDGVYIGELLVHGLTNRSEGNGFINSDESKEKVYIQLWDFVTLDEYSRGKDKKNKTVYSDRFAQLSDNVTEDTNVLVIETHTVKNISEALQWTSKWMNEGLEGAILKDSKNIFVDHTSPTQLKLKLEIDAEVRVTGFLEGTPGTKREKTFGSITFENDEGTIKGRTSGFSDAQLEDFNSRREELIGKVFTVQFNDITKARNSDTWAFSHPRFIGFRDDKNTTDTLERVQESKEMAMMLETK